MRSFLFLFLFSATLFASQTGSDEVRNCINDILKAPTLDGIQNCFNRAQKLSESTSLQDRSVYFRALGYYLRLDYSNLPNSYGVVYNQLSNYYVGHLLKDLNEQNIRNSSDIALGDIFQAPSTLIFYGGIISTDQLGLRGAEMAFDELEKRGAATSDYATALVSYLLKNSEWEKARLISERYPAIGKLPEIRIRDVVNKNELGYFSLSVDQTTLTLHKFEIGSGPQIVMYGDCHFALDAIKSLAENKTSRNAMEKIGMVFASPSLTEFETISSFRARYPAFELHPIYKSGSWFQGGFNIWASPNFTFFLNGVPVYNFEGFSPKLAEQFCEGLKRIGYVKADNCE